MIKSIHAGCLHSVCVLILICFAACIQIKESSCRFARGYTADDLLTSEESLNQFLREFVKWQGEFIYKVGIDRRTGMTYDGARVDVDTGELLPGGLHQFTASSKESIHIGLLAKVLQGVPFSELICTPLDAFRIITLKANTYEAFAKNYPGFGGYLPWVDLKGDIPKPTYDFKDRVPALDNGEMFWAALSLSQVWQSKYPGILPQVREQWDDNTWKPIIRNARKMFYNETTRKIRAVAKISNISLPVHENTYSNDEEYYIDDPYEGELFIWIITLLGKDQFTDGEINDIWIGKRSKLQAVNYTVSKLNSTITVERGCWFSSHQQWKNLFMPYNFSSTYRVVQSNNELARIWHSALNSLPGMYASMSGPASNNQEDTGYFSDAGIAAISFNPIAFNKLVTPYSTFPLMLVDRRLGAIWLHNMLLSPAAQTKYGALEGTGLNGTLISPVLTWDTKITTVLAVLGGTRNIIAQWLNKTGLLEEFTTRLEGEYKNQFGDIAAPELAWILPSTTISTGRPDFSSCI